MIFLILILFLFTTTSSNLAHAGGCTSSQTRIIPSKSTSFIKAFISFEIDEEDELGTDGLQPSEKAYLKLFYRLHNIAQSTKNGDDEKNDESKYNEENEDEENYDDVKSFDEEEYLKEYNELSAQQFSVMTVEEENVLTQALNLSPEEREGLLFKLMQASFKKKSTPSSTYKNSPWTSSPSTPYLLDHFSEKEILDAEIEADEE